MKLNISKPLITSSPTIAAIFSIVSNQEFADTWIVNSFNNLLFIENKYENRCIFFEDQPNNRETILADLNFFRYNRIKYDVVNYLLESIVDFLRKSIDNKYYIRIALDNYYLPLNRNAYNKEHFLHPVLIYGYDNKSSTFLVGEFFDKKNFDFYSIPYFEVEKAYYNSVYSLDETEEYLENIILVKVDNSYIPEAINIPKIIEETNDYFCGTDNSNKYRYRKRKKESLYYYGVKCYDCFIKTIENNCFDIRAAHVIYDRMVIFSYKHKVLYNNKLISESDFNNLNMAVSELKLLALQNRNLLLKIAMKYDKSSLPQKYIMLLNEKYNALKYSEIQYLKEFVNVLERTFRQI